MSNKNILILYAHPNHNNSRINRALIKGIADLDHVLINPLYEIYYDFYIDVKREQNLLVEADLIVFQHPFYWYSSPAILKEWQDRVLEQGFAYGEGGTSLHGKDMISVISCGGRETSYGPEGHNQYTIKELLRPFETMANLCGINYKDPIVIQGSFDKTDQEISEHVDRYRQFLLQYQVATNTKTG